MPDEPVSAGPPPNPYVGPKPFATGEGHLFFGRNVEIRDLASLIVSHREVVLYSQSGAGKTSLLRAGVFPRLDKRGFEVLSPARVVGPVFTDRVVRDRIRNVFAFNVLRGWAPPGGDPAPLYTQSIKEYLAALPAPDGDARRLRILILDQFEELFTTYPERWKDREQFLAQVADALVADRSLRVMFAIREEYIGRLRRFEELFPNNLRQWYHLERLREGPALDAVTGPASRAGRPYEAGVAEDVVRRLLPIRVDVGNGMVEELPGEFVEPVHLQIVCCRIWNRLTDAQKTITQSHVGAHGDVDEALQEYYETQVVAVAEGTGLSQTKLRRWFERKFITDDSRRGRVFEQDGFVGGLPSTVALNFQRAYLLRSDSQGDTVWFELAHDRLVTAVQMAAKQNRLRTLPMRIAAAGILLTLGFGGASLVYLQQLRAMAPQRTISVRSASGTVTGPPGDAALPAPSDVQVITIPVVVHVVYNTDAQNVSDAQIASQLAVLNKDFRALNDDIRNVPEPFKPALGDAHIAFILAKADPEQRLTTGITRTRTSRTTFSSDDGVKSRKTGGVDPWPANRYLNIWVANLSGGMLGYSQFPDGPADTDGLVAHYQAFGTIGTALAPFNRGRTTTHNIGEYLNLRHIWGDTEGCEGSDNVEDTPNQAGPNFGKPSFPVISCGNGPNGDMFMNFMDYVDDESMFMFTKGQVARMRETLSTFRRGLWTP